MRVYLTNGGVLVQGDGTKWRLDKKTKAWKVPCWRAETGGRHGWLWLHNLREIE